MIFLHPALLYLVPLAAVPILLHLLTLHRLRTVELSTFRFLFDSYVQQRRRMRLLEALLAMLRTLFLLLLVMMVCRPVIRHWRRLFGAAAGQEVVLLLDCSASMGARAAGMTALDRAKSAALSVVQRLGPADRVTLFRLAGLPQELFSRFASDAEAIGEQIQALQTGPARANIFTALDRVFGPRARYPHNLTVYLFTDCQATGWREVLEQGLHDMVPAQARLVVVNVGSKEPLSNRAVLGLPPSESRPVVGLPVLLRPRVANFSTTQTVDVTLSVFIDEKEVARHRMRLGPGESQTRDVVYVPAEPGPHRGRFEIDADRFPDDDSFLFSLAATARLKVLLVNGSRSRDPFEDDGLYVRTALVTAAGGSAAGDEVLRRLGPQRPLVESLQLREIAERELSQKLLDESAVVILANCGRLNRQQFGWLRNFVDSGGGLIILPGDRVRPDLYNKQLFPIPGPGEQSITAVRLAEPEGDPERSETFERLAAVDFAHPVLSVFDDPDSEYLTTANFYRRFPLLVPSGAERAWVLARFSTGSAALVETRWGQAVMLLAAFPANAKWGNLVLKPEFVPLLLRMVAYAARRPQLQVPAAVMPGTVAEITADGSWRPATAAVTDPAGHRSELTLQRSAGRLVAAFEGTDRKGYYQVSVSGGAGQRRQSGSGLFAVNIEPAESEFKMIGRQQLADLLPEGQLTWVDASAEAQQLYGPIGDEREIWRPLILAMFLIIGLEFLMATGTGRTDSRPTGPGTQSYAGKLARIIHPKDRAGHLAK